MKKTTSSKRNVKLNKILDRTIRNIYGIVFKRLKSHASFIRCRIKRLLEVLLYNTGYIWTRTQLEKSYWTSYNDITARPIWLFKLCTRPNIFPYCTVKRLITYNYNNVQCYPVLFIVDLHDADGPVHLSADSEAAGARVHLHHGDQQVGRSWGSITGTGTQDGHRSWKHNTVRSAYKEPAYKEMLDIRNWFSFSNLEQGTSTLYIYKELR